MPGYGDVYHVGQLENVTGTCRCSLFLTGMKQGRQTDSLFTSLSNDRLAMLLPFLFANP